jgi:hypothetical protein
MRWTLSSSSRDTLVLVAVSLTLAAVSARPYAGSWNDGSRLATVESVLDRQTLQIDNSIFCHPPADSIARGQAPYHPADQNLIEHGTRDKAFIAGHFYSEKPVIISFGMAGTYQVGRWLGLPSPRERPDVFCWVLTFLFSGGAFTLSLVCLDRLCRAWQLTDRARRWLVASMGLSTFALTYTRHVNNHILLLAVFSLILVQANALLPARRAWVRLAWLGTLAGVGFNLDLGSGPLLVVALGLFVLWRYRRPAPLLWLALFTTPWVVGWEYFNYAVGGVWKPINMVPGYMQWPGSPFTPDNLTGFVDQGLWHKLVYAVALLVGKHGFFVHNLPMLLAVPGGWWALRKPTAQRPLLVFAVGWCVVAWLMYALLSNNYGGTCCSIRWFVPFLVAGFLVLALYLKEHPGYEADLKVLGAWGAVLAVRMWWQGPFTLRMVLWLWPAAGAALLSWTYLRRRKGSQPQSRTVVERPEIPLSRAA